MFKNTTFAPDGSKEVCVMNELTKQEKIALYRDNGTFVLVEYQGQQHYTDNNWNWISPKENDAIKREFCSQNNIELIEIPYWDYEKLDWNYIKEKCKL